MATLTQPPVSYPGVYVVEVPEGNSTIAGVPTSVTAFVGRTAMGLVQSPTLVTSFGQFSQLFGGLSEDYPVTYAVNDFFNNGGTQALIVRLVSVPMNVARSNWEVAGAVCALVSLSNAVSAGNDTGGAIDPSKCTPVLTDPDATAAIAAVASAWKAAVGTTYANAKGAAALAVPFAETVVAYVGYLNLWTPPSPPPLLPTTTQKLVVADAATLQKLVTTTSAPTPSSAFDADLAQALSETRGPAKAECDLFPPVTFSTAGEPLVPAMLGAATVVGQVWSVVANQLVVQTAASLVSAAQMAVARLPADQVSGGVAMLRAATAAAQPSGATPEAVEAALLTAFVGLNSPTFSATELLYLGLCGCRDYQSTMIALCGDPTVAGSTVQLPAVIDTVLKVKNNATAAAWAVVVGADPYTAQDAIDELKATALNMTPIAVIEAADEGGWANGAVSVQVSTANVSPGTQQQMAAYGIKVASVFACTVVYSPPGSPNSNVTTYPYATLTSGTPWSLDTLLTADPYVRVASGMDASGVPDDCGPVSLEGGVDSPALADSDYIGDQNQQTGMYSLLKADIFNLLCIPWDEYGTDTSVTVWQAAQSFCAQQRAILLVDPPAAWKSLLPQATLPNAVTNFIAGVGGGIAQRNSSIYFPMLTRVDPLQNNQVRAFPPCGAIAGIIANTDATRGVWKAPAGVGAAFSMIAGLDAGLTDVQNGQLNPLGLNCLRSYSNYGSVIWGDRTMRGATELEDEYMYLSVRRLALYVEESMRRGLIWAVFEPNDESLWSSLRASVTSFMSSLQSKGAFYSFTVQCDATTTTEENIKQGVVNVVIGFAPVEPAEFVVLYFQQTAGASPASS